MIVDGGYAKDTVLLPLMEEGVRIVTRLRKDAKLFEVPPPRTKGQRGASRKYGARISLEEQTWYEDGWETVECRQYGKHVQKTINTFVATSQIARGKPGFIWQLGSVTQIANPLSYLIDHSIAEQPRGVKSGRLSLRFCRRFAGSAGLSVRP